MRLYMVSEEGTKLWDLGQKGFTPSQSITAVIYWQSVEGKRNKVFYLQFTFAKYTSYLGDV